MNIGILGSGSVAQTLGAGFASKGHKVRLGTRDASKLNDWAASARGNASVGSFADAAEFGVVVIVAVSGSVALEAIALAGAKNFNGKTVIDVTNPLDFSQGVPPGFAATLGNSLAEQIQRAVPNANVVKAFNMITAAVMVDPKFGGDTASLFIAGDDKGAKDAVARLAGEFGWEVVDFGGLSQAYFLEAFAAGFINYAFATDDWQRGFKFLNK